MALRDQPYLPLYVQDFMTDEKLSQCSAESIGVYIFIICILHKTEEYGKFLLKQKDKQTEQQVNNFAIKLSKQMPFSNEVINRSLIELLEEKVIYISEDYLIQGRMVKDNELSLIRSQAGKSGGLKTSNNLLKQKDKQINKLAKPKRQPNAEYEDEIENVIKDVFDIELKERFKTLFLSKKWIKKELSTLESTIKKSKEYESKFMIQLVDKAIIGEHQGLFFSSTDKEYQDYLKVKNTKASEILNQKDISGKQYNGTKF